MTPTAYICLLIGGWFVSALAMLWGVLRIARQHQQAQERHTEVERTEQPEAPAATRQPATGGGRDTERHEEGALASIKSRLRHLRYHPA